MRCVSRSASISAACFASAAAVGWWTPSCSLLAPLGPCPPAATRVFFGVPFAPRDGRAEDVFAPRGDRAAAALAGDAADCPPNVLGGAVFGGVASSSVASALGAWRGALSADLEAASSSASSRAIFEHASSRAAFAAAASSWAAVAAISAERSRAPSSCSSCFLAAAREVALKISNVPLSHFYLTNQPLRSICSRRFGCSVACLKHGTGVSALRSPQGLLRRLHLCPHRLYLCSRQCRS